MGVVDGGSGYGNAFGADFAEVDAFSGGGSGGGRWRARRRLSRGMRGCGRGGFDDGLILARSRNSQSWPFAPCARTLWLVERLYPDYTARFEEVVERVVNATLGEAKEFGAEEEVGFAFDEDEGSTAFVDGGVGDGIGLFCPDFPAGEDTRGTAGSDVGGGNRVFWGAMELGDLMALNAEEGPFAVVAP